jgi:TonB family protein
MRASRVRTESCAYDIEIRWGDGELYREHVYPAESFVLVTREHSDSKGARHFVVDEPWIGGRERCLVSLRDGEAYVHDVDGERPLVRGVHTTMLVGPLAVRIAAAEPELHARVPAAVDVKSHAWTFASLFVHALALSCMALMPPRASSLSLDHLNEDLRYMQYLTTPVQREPVELPWSEAGPGALASSSKAPGEEGSTGKPDTPSKGRLAVKGRTPERAVQKVDASNVGAQGILGVLARATSRVGSPSPYASNQALGYDPMDALGQLFGENIGEGNGTGLGLKHTGRGGGGDPLGTIGVGQLATIGGGPGGPGGEGYGPGATVDRPRRKERAPQPLRVGEAQVRGSLSKEAIRRAIHLRLNEVRFCYEQALRSRPDLSGRVSVAFLIAPLGNVQGATVASSSLAHGEAEACVLAAVRRIGFPAPEGGGYVHVTYPFLFESAD